MSAMLLNERTLVELNELIDQYEILIGETAVESLIQLHDKFSTRNALLIGMQSPEATDVRKYPDWLVLGRRVRHGERGIRVIMGKDFVSVFDVLQTEELAR